MLPIEQEIYSKKNRHLWMFTCALYSYAWWTGEECKDHGDGQDRGQVPLRQVLNILNSAANSEASCQYRI